LLLRIDFITGQSADDLSKKQALVAKAIELDSNNSQAYKKMLKLCESSDAPENRQVMIQLLERQVAEGVSIAFAHFALGTAKWIDGSHDEALWHTERALELEPNLSDIANNLAWLSAQGDSPDLQRSLKLIESAIKKRPGDVRYRDTRGVILMKLQRWEDALTDFETILPQTVGDERRELHTRLATIYQQLGKDGMAKIHEQQAQDDKE
jgi:tetratricopeptide (TPR) repeat protein